jgi:hypothetical protein
MTHKWLRKFQFSRKIAFPARRFQFARCGFVHKETGPGCPG